MLHLRTVLLIGVTTNAGGFTSLGLPIPAKPSVIGASFYTQALVIDPVGPFFGLAITRGVRVSTGE